MMIECPECGHGVSSAAVACPNCGHPISQPAAVPPPGVRPQSSDPVSRQISPTSPGYRSAKRLSFGLSATVASFWWATAVFYGFAALGLFAAFGNWSLYEDGRISFVEMVDSDNISTGMVGVATFLMWVTAILFIIWFFQAYKVARSRGAVGTRWAVGWTIGGWFIPLANFVIPKLVMNEVDRMSNPLAGEPPIEERWKPMPRLVTSDIWWILFLLGSVIWWLGFFSYDSEPGFTGSAVGIGYLLMTASQIAYAASAALAGVVAFSIGKRLRKP